MSSIDHAGSAATPPTEAGEDSPVLALSVEKASAAGVIRDQRRVVCAALRIDEQLVLGARHFDALMHAHLASIGMSNRGRADVEQGFVDQRGQFLTRAEAWDVAVAAGQVLRRVGGDGARLYSENLY